MGRVTCSAVGLALLASVPSRFIVPAAAQQLSPALTREWRVDGSSEDLTPIRALAVSASGTVAVIQHQDSRILFFGKGGKRLGAYGRNGAGPGEFRSMQGTLGWAKDTAWFAEHSQDRTTFIGPDHKFLRSEPTPRSIVPAPGATALADPVGSAAVKARLGNGELVLFVSAPRKLPAWLPAIAGASGNIAVRASGAGEFKAFVGGVPRSASRCLKEIAGGSIGVSFCSAPASDIEASTGVMAIVEPEPGGGPTYRVTAIRGDRGDTIFSKSFAFRPTAIPAKVIDSTRQEKLRQPGLSPAMKAGYQSMQYPSHYPPIRRVLVGRDGTVWLLEDHGRVDVRRWVVLSASGVRLGSIDVPVHVGFGAVSRTRVWTIESDADGIQSIGQYRVGKLGA